MHFEILVEDISGKRMLDTIVPNIIGTRDSFRVHSYKGLGRIPVRMKSVSEANRRILLEQLPRILKGYGNTFADRGGTYQAAVIIVCDLDDKCLRVFRRELRKVLDSCPRRPLTRFCIAVEEGEAWYLGDRDAVLRAYPNARSNVLDRYVKDSICGTWELLADALHPGGRRGLLNAGSHAIGEAKSQWASRIAPHMDVDRNTSPSFRYFRDKLREFIDS